MTKALRIGVFGATGTGKGLWTIRQIQAANPPRLMVWDFKHDPWLKGIGQDVRTPQELAFRTAEKEFKVRYLVDHDRDIDIQFEFFCKVAWARSRLLMFVDELPEVTKANRAPALWRKCVNVGRSYTAPDGKPGHLSIIGAGQRAAETDKSFIGNLDVLHVGRMGNDADARALAGYLGCNWRELLTLPDLHYIERVVGQSEPLRGNITLQKKGPTPRAKPKA